MRTLIIFTYLKHCNGFNDFHTTTLCYACRHVWYFYCVLTLFLLFLFLFSLNAQITASSKKPVHSLLSTYFIIQWNYLILNIFTLVCTFISLRWVSLVQGCIYGGLVNPSLIFENPMLFSNIKRSYFEKRNPYPPKKLDTSLILLRRFSLKNVSWINWVDAVL